MSAVGLYALGLERIVLLDSHRATPDGKRQKIDLDCAASMIARVKHENEQRMNREKNRLLAEMLKNG